MNNDILPPKSPWRQDSPQPTIPPKSEPAQPGAVASQSASKPGVTNKRRRWSPKLWLPVVVGVLAIGCSAAIWWYTWAIQAPNRTSTHTEKFVVTEGMTADQIGTALEEKGFIRSRLAFRVYTQLQGVRGELQAGSYQLSRNESLADIVKNLQEAKSQDLVVTFYPGAVLRDPRTLDDSKRTDVYTMLQRAGFSDQAITTGLNAPYTHDLFAGKPAGSSLEGYVFGETYRFDADATVEAVLKHTFDVYYRAVQKSGIIESAKQRGLTLYQAITLASIVQREVSNGDDQKKVAQVFYKRLAEGMPLGSDVTFIYAADQRNVPRAVDLDSPYNTRIHAGLPPGPIATPGVSALEAVAHPAATDYLYFVAGDDGNTYFGKTAAEHDQNVAKYCHKLCSEL